MNFLFSKSYCVLAVLSFGALGTASSNASEFLSTAKIDPPVSLAALLAAGPTLTSSSTDVPEIRSRAVREGGVAHGARSGLARRTLEIKNQLEKTSVNLDVIYNFQPLLIEGNVVPPVLTEMRDVYDQKDDNLIRVIDVIYKIDQQPRFVFTPPTWRSYLFRDYQYQTGTIGISPAGDAELVMWKTSVAIGWEEGRKQADRIFEEDLSRLKRDFEGIIRYKSMLSKGMVTKPFVAAAPLGVTGNSNVMNVNETVLRIMAAPEFTLNSNNWKKQEVDILNESSKPDPEVNSGGRRQIVFTEELSIHTLKTNKGSK